MPQFIQVSAPFFPITKWILKEKYFEISYSTAVHRLRICPQSHVCMCINIYIYIYIYIYVHMYAYVYEKNNIYNPTYHKHVHKLICDSHLTTVPMVCHYIPPSIGPSISPGSMSTVVIVSEVKGLRPGRPIHAIWIPRFLGLLTRMTTKTSFNRESL